MKLSVIIPTCHRNDLLALCLDRLAPGRQTLAGEEYEVIVTDDGSRSTAEAMIAECYAWCRWIQGPRRGPAANRNSGARQANARWLVMTDDDCLPQPGFLRAYLDAIQTNPATEIFEGRTSADRPKQHPLEGAPINQTGGCLWSCNLAITVRLFEHIGRFNEVFPYAAMEDLDFAKRVRQSGARPLFVPDAEIIHPWRRLDLKSHTKKHMASILIYARLHPNERHLFTFRQHLKNTVRYYLNDFPAELREFGWLAVRHQPLHWWDTLYRGWHFARAGRAAAEDSNKLRP